ncbi:unnamed protein product [Polarella glacialis]|uniref:Protein kinase domain-containing protein n=1 Tax=Polarella glacialis TaxID=89957 RepID=A0A813D5A5_POLGL|nr:unnamed protein product [Polarella glacialis]
MECIAGGQLFPALANPRIAITEGCVASIGRQLFEALQHLHERNVVHRDVKAENILLVDNPTKSCRWHIKLIDFGLAMRTEQSSSFMFTMCKQEVTMDQLICGTAYYCAPEVWFNDYGPRVDVWAAGVVLYVALFGAFPFYDKSPAALEVLICEDGKEPSYEPVGTSDAPGFQVSSLATDCLKQLLSKAQEDRPDASTALRLEWLHAGAAFEGYSNAIRVPSGSFRGAGGGIGSVGGVQLLGSWDQVIPPSIRVKAGRAAASPPVEAEKERRRTAALEEIKVRSCGNNTFKSLPTPNRGGFSRESTAGSVRPCSSRDMEVSCAEVKGFGVPFYLRDHDQASTAEHFTDSEGEEVRPRMASFCSCH